MITPKKVAGIIPEMKIKFVAWIRVLNGIFLKKDTNLYLQDFRLNTFETRKSLHTFPINEYNIQFKVVAIHPDS